MEDKLARCKEAYTQACSRLSGEDKLKGEFDKVFRALEKSSESTGRLKAKTVELESEIASHSERVAKGKLEEDGQQAGKRLLLEEIAKNHRRIDELKRGSLQERITALKATLSELRAFCEHGAGWTPEQEAKLAALQKKQADTEHHLEQKLTNLQLARQDIECLGETVETSEKGRLELEAETGEVKAAIAETERDCQAAQARRDRVDGELRALKLAVEQHQVEQAARQQLLAEGEAEAEALEGKLRGAKQKMEHYLGEYDSLFQQTHKLTESLEEQQRVNTYLQEELSGREAEAEQLSKEARAVRKETEKTAQMVEFTADKTAGAEKARDKSERERAQLRDLTKAVEAETGTARRENEQLQRQLDELTKEREILDKTLLRAEDKTKQAHDLIAVLRNTHCNLENEVQGYKADAIRERAAIEALEAEVQKYDGEVGAEHQRFLNAQEEVRMQDARVAELQRLIAEGDGKLKQQQNLYEAVRSDRNLYSKNLIEAQDQIAEMRRRFKILNHQIEQLKEEITGKDHLLVKEHFDHHKVEKEKEILENELTKIHKQTASSEQIIANQETEIRKLSQIMHDAEEEQARQEKEYGSIISERDLLGAQLIRRNEELAALYETIKVQMSALRRGEAQFNEMVRHLEKLRGAVVGLTRERRAIEAEIGDMPALDSEVLRLERELAQEKSKVKALADEMERPLNVHRWRKLESSDPHRFALIRKIQDVQVTLLAKTDEVAQKTRAIEDKEKLYVELKEVLARQPGAEVAEQLSLYQNNLKDKQRQIKEMSAQLDKARAQVSEYKIEIDALNRHRLKLNKAFFARKKKEFSTKHGAANQHHHHDDESSDDDDSSDDQDTSSDDGSAPDSDDEERRHANEEPRHANETAGRKDKGLTEASELTGLTSP